MKKSVLPAGNKTAIKKEPTLTRDGINYQALYDHCLDSKMTVRAIAKYLKKAGVDNSLAASFCSAVGITTDLSPANKMKCVAIEVWQQQRISQGKERWQSPSVPEDLINLP
jgi:hypothetical protein